MNRSAVTIAVIPALAGALLIAFAHLNVPGGILIAIGIIVAVSLRTINEWERAVVLRLGRFSAIRGPGIFLMLPMVETIYTIVDTRRQSTIITAENTLTMDGVSVAVDSILFWKVEDVRRAATELVDYRSMIGQVAQTSLREAISAMRLDDILGQREIMDQKVRDAIAGKSRDWGIGHIAVEMRDVRIPPELNDAMSRNAQAEKEKQARVTLSSAEAAIAQQIALAAAVYHEHPIALQIRQMNLLYEMNKDRGATILVPTEMASAMASLFQRPVPGAAEKAQP